MANSCQVTFYLLNPNHETATVANGDTVAAELLLGCELAAQLYRQQKRVFVFADSEQQGLLIDEQLWSFAADSFVPHNLAGEGPRQGAPVEISWQPPANHRQVMINFATLVPGFFNQFNQIIDFVPNEPEAKQAARERYKYYRQCGCQLETIKLE